MKRIILVLLCCCVMLSSLGACAREAQPVLPDLTNEQVLELIADAYIYALPLVLMDLTVKNTTNPSPGTAYGAPLNQFNHAEQLIQADDKTVVRSNVDTLYSVAFLETSEEPIIFSKPETERYCSVAVFDAYSNCVAELGTGGMDDGKAAVYAFCGPGYDGAISDEIVRLDIPTDLLWVIVRIEYTDAETLNEIHAIQEKLTLYPLSGYGDPEYVLPPRGEYNPDYDYIPLERLAEMDVEEFFNTFNELAAKYPGTDADKPMLEQIAKVGVGPGLTFRLGDFVEEAIEQIKDIPPRVKAKLREDAAETHDTGLSFFTFANGWRYPADHIAHFGTDYTFRALIALTGFGANPVDMAEYPTTGIDSEGNDLEGSNNYIIHFEPGQLPPCKAFWSITVYDSKGFFYVNEIEKQAIRNTDPFIINEDGSVDFYLQNESPGEGLEANWLPVPKEGISLALRIYQPDESVLDFTWKPPAVVKVD